MPIDLIDGLHRGEFPEHEKELKVQALEKSFKIIDILILILFVSFFSSFMHVISGQCFTMCIAQTAGTVRFN